MIRDLTPEEIDEVLREELIGRIGCSGERGVYIIPLAYAYDGAFVYCYSADRIRLNEKAGRLESTPIDDRRVHERRRS
jgi:nitroimidazol reductase NimA-like FMN-containing flavoprotein (pyridoxamine 5'-phosphate oxidase superfamily)